MAVVYGGLMRLAMTNDTRVLKSGNEWVEKVYAISGNWVIEEIEGETYFVLRDNFSTSPGPDLKLYLTHLSMSEIDDRRQIDRDGTFIAELVSNSGSQRYPLPTGTDLSDYRSLVIIVKPILWFGEELR